jgi:hypothetical protein
VNNREDADTSKPSGQHESGSLRDDLNLVVGVSLFTLLLVNLGLNAALSWALDTQFDPGPKGWAQFAGIYLSTWSLSTTLTIAIASYAVPRIYGRDTNPLVPYLVLVAGAFVTSLAMHRRWNPLHDWSWDAPVLMLGRLILAALLVFSQLYGHDLLSGTITGLGGGIMLTVIVASRRGATASERTPRVSWAAGLATIILILFGSALLADYVASHAVVGP